MVLPTSFYWHSTLLHSMWVPTGLENSGGFLLKVVSVYIKSTETFATSCTLEDILMTILLVSESWKFCFTMRWITLTISKAVHFASNVGFSCCLSNKLLLEPGHKSARRRQSKWILCKSYARVPQNENFTSKKKAK